MSDDEICVLEDGVDEDEDLPLAVYEEEEGNNNESVRPTMKRKVKSDALLGVPRAPLDGVHLPSRPDIGVIVVLEAEFEGLRMAFEEVDKDILSKPEDLHPDEKTRTHIYYRTRSPISGFHLVVCVCDKQGVSELPSAVKRLTSHYQVRTIVLIGVSGSLNSKDLGIGHVVVADSIVDYSHRAALVSDGDHHAKILHGGAYWNATDELVQGARHFSHTHRQALNDWTEKCTSLRSATIGSNVSQELRDLLGSDVSLHVGPIAAGVFVVKGQRPKEDLLDTNRTLLAVDTESHGVADQLLKLHREKMFADVHFLIMRAVSDTSNEKKETLDKLKLAPESPFVKASRGGRLPAFQILAAYNAAQLLISFVTEGMFKSSASQLIEDFAEAKKRKDAASAEFTAVEKLAINMMRGLASERQASHIYAENKTGTNILVYIKASTAQRASVTDYKAAIKKILPGPENKTKRYSIDKVVREAVESRPEKPREKVELITSTQGQRKKVKPELVSLPPSQSMSESTTITTTPTSAAIPIPVLVPATMEKATKKEKTSKKDKTAKKHKATKTEATKSKKE